MEVVRSDDSKFDTCKFFDFEARKFVEKHYEPVEDKPGYVWLNKRHMQIISIDVLVAAYLKGMETEVKKMTHQYMEIKIKELEKRIEALEKQGKTETVTEFADRCWECGARYGKLLAQQNNHENISLGFVEPSGTYNIVLSIDDLKLLISGKPVLIRPLKTTIAYKDNRDAVITKELGALSIDFYGKNEEPHPIQYVSIWVNQE